MNKILHAVALTVFAGACWFLAMILKLPLMIQSITARLHSVPPDQAVLPAFTRLCMTVGPIILAALAMLALGYCIYVWVRKTDRPASWTGFLAIVMTAIVVAMLPTVVALYLPVVDLLNRSAVTLK